MSFNFKWMASKFYFSFLSYGPFNWLWNEVTEVWKGLFKQTAKSYEDRLYVILQNIFLRLLNWRNIFIDGFELQLAWLALSKFFLLLFTHNINRKWIWNFEVKNSAKKLSQNYSKLIVHHSLAWVYIGNSFFFCNKYETVNIFIFLANTLRVSLSLWMTGLMGLRFL